MVVLIFLLLKLKILLVLLILELVLFLNKFFIFILVVLYLFIVYLILFLAKIRLELIVECILLAKIAKLLDCISFLELELHDVQNLVCLFKPLLILLRIRCRHLGLDFIVNILKGECIKIVDIFWDWQLHQHLFNYNDM